MNKTFKILAAAALCASVTGAHAANAIIVNPKNANKVSSQDAKDLFSGKAKTFADGSSAIAVLAKTGKSRDAFLSEVLGKTESQYKSAWAALVFTGKAQSPREVESDDEVLKLIATNPNMIGVVDSGKADGSVKDISK